MGIALSAALTVLVTAHLFLVIGLARGVGLRRERVREALFGLIAPPLAPWWGWRRGMRAPVVLWVAALAAYTLGLIVATGARDVFRP
jgi:hypothetical protein